MTKKLILTIDYEIFFGKNHGTVYETMIEPTNRLMNLLEKYDSKMTVFWDVLHYWKLLQISKEFPELKSDIHLIENQVLNLCKKGHEVQLHIHPHWIDANYDGLSWSFNYNQFSLHKLSQNNDPTDIRSIIGCITIAKKSIENLINKDFPNHKIYCFRAGAYLIEPFESIREGLIRNKITVDSTVCPNRYVEKGEFSFNYIGYPNRLHYGFKDNLKRIENDGEFLEIPIRTVQLKVRDLVNFYIKKKIKYKNLKQNRPGEGVGSILKLSKLQKFKIKVEKLLKSNYHQLTTDNSFKEKYFFLIEKVPEYSCQILHPKLYNLHSHSILEEGLKMNNLKFISIGDYLSIHKLDYLKK